MLFSVTDLLCDPRQVSEPLCLSFLLLLPEQNHLGDLFELKILGVCRSLHTPIPTLHDFHVLRSLSKTTARECPNFLGPLGQVA